MPLLGINIDHVATLRQARRVDYPDPIIAAQLAQDAGADQITCHLREDRRHMQDADIPRLQKAVSIPINLEMAATEEMKAFALQHRPQKITLVPEKREELTTEGGLEVVGHAKKLQGFIFELKQAGMEVSLFIDPKSEQIMASQKLGVTWVEFHTGTYCNLNGEAQIQELKRLQKACTLAKDQGLKVAAGHGLTLENIIPVKQIKEIEEFNIGHFIVCHAVMVGIERAVREMKDVIA